MLWRILFMAEECPATACFLGVNCPSDVVERPCISAILRAKISISWYEIVFAEKA